MLWFEFKAKKSTQAAAFLLKLCSGQKGKYLLLKMLYLADREALRVWGIPITGDEPHSMEYGPVPSHIYDLTKGAIRHGQEWSRSIETRDNEMLVLKSDPGTDELSEDEMSLLRTMFEKYKNFSFKQMKEYCHGLAEYDSSVGNSSRPISLATMLSALGKSRDEVMEVSNEILELRELRAIFSK
jgi:hypothetical protein